MTTCHDVGGPSAIPSLEVAVVSWPAPLLHRDKVYSMQMYVGMPN